MKVLVTGGAGFIGSNVVKRYLDAGHEVVVVDNLARKGAEKNLAWLQTQGRFQFYQLDIRHYEPLAQLLHQHADINYLLHLAGQVAVTTSVVDPRPDFEANAFGTFNVLEALRCHAPEAVLVYSSTNKVYGSLEHVGVINTDTRYQFRDRPQGIAETESLDFHSPYGCSKGAADQYVRDYARIYNLRTVSLRQSCIYGYRQFGVEDQGWVAWFIIAAVLQRPITIYGDGKQVRDLLFIDDLCDLYDLLYARIDQARGQIYNVGGGVANQFSLLELLAYLEQLIGRPIAVQFADWRPGDQPVFICDIGKVVAELGWRPQTSVMVGVEKLYRWVFDNKEIFA
jgi:CDP-paratose 2-epimerase